MHVRKIDSFQEIISFENIIVLKIFSKGVNLLGDAILRFGKRSTQVCGKSVRRNDVHYITQCR